MSDNFDVIVDFSMDQEGQKEVIDGTKSVETHLKEMEAAAKNAGKTVSQVMKEASKQAGTFAQAEEKAGEEVKKTTEDIQKQAKEAARSATAQAQVWSQEARILNTRGRLLQLQSRDMLKYADAINIVSRTALIAGTAITGGILKAATDYIKNAPNATRLTVQWNEAQDRINRSYSRFGAVAVQAALPLLEQAARLSEKAAGFIERNPELVRGALNVGLVTAALGTIGMLVSKGIKLQADLLFVQSVPIMQEAATLNMAAAQQMLVAAQLNAESKGIEVATGAEAGLTKAAATGAGGLGGVLSGIGGLVGPLAAFAAGLIATDKVFDAIQGHDVAFKDYVVEFKQALAIDAKKFGDWLSGIGLKTPGGTKFLFQQNTGDQMFKDLSKALGLLKGNADDTAKSLDALAGSVAASPKKDELLAAYEKYEADDLQLVQDHYAKRTDIVTSGLQAEEQANSKYRGQVSGVGADTAKALADLQNNYDAEYLKAEQEHAKRRADILQGAGDDIKKIEENLQETLRKNFLEHQNRTEDIIAARDALGLAKENRRFEQQQAEEKRSANLEIKRLRADLAKRLQEFEAEYAAERVQRYQEFVQRAIEIKQQAAERLKELATQHAEEIKQIRAQTAAKLKEEDSQFQAERKRRYDYFVAQIRDLDAALLGERNLRLQRQEQMLTDLDAFLARYRAGLQGITNTPTPGKSTGGYTSGMVMTGETGYEWIATHASTTTAENIIGTKLTQENFLKAMQALKASNNNTYVDNRRLEVPMNKETKEAYRQGAIEAMKELLGV